MEPLIAPNKKDLRTRANELRKSGVFEDAAALYEVLWKDEAHNEWDGWGYAFCLHKLHRTEEALDICRQVYRIAPDMPQVRQVYAWCVYDLEIALEEVHDVNRFLKAASGILKLVDQSDKFAPYTSTVLKVCRQLQQRNRNQDVLTWLDRLDAGLLSNEPFTITGKNGRDRKVPSDLQRYYTFRVKALNAMNRHDECRACVDEALEAVPVFVNDGDIWLLRLKALSLVAQGDLDTAFADLEELLHRKATWFLYNDLAGLAWRQGDRDTAWQYLLHALLDKTPAELRINVFQQAAEWHLKEGRTRDAALHVSLVLGIRKERGWPVRPGLQALSRSLNVSDQNLESSSSLLKSLRSAWQKNLEKLEPRNRGTVDRILDDGCSGFVQTGDGNRYYFKSRSLQGLLRQGMEVSFRTEPGYDRKRDRPTVNAVDVKPA